MTEQAKVKMVQCPTCKKPARFEPANAFRPFCSAVCKDRDIIAWAQGDFAIAGPTVEEEEQRKEDSQQSPARRPVDPQ